MQNNLSVVAFFPNELCVCARRSSFFPAKETGGKNHTSMGKIERQSVIIGFFLFIVRLQSSNLFLVSMNFGWHLFGLFYVDSSWHCLLPIHLHHIKMSPKIDAAKEKEVER